MNVLPPFTGAHTTSGKRAYQHDRFLIHHTTRISLYAVADGHGCPTNGHVVAEHICQDLVRLLEAYGLLGDISRSDAGARLQKAIAELDTRCLHKTATLRVYAGSTLCLVLYDRVDNVCLVANVGDSRVVMVKDMEVCALSRDHVPTDSEERARIEEAGGWVIGGMLNGYVSMSRALGDEDLKGHRNMTKFADAGRKKFGERLFTGEAEIGKWEIESGDLALVLASDGVWGKMSNHMVGEVVRGAVGKGKEVGEIAKAVVKKAMGKGSCDNVTVVVGMVFADDAGSDGTDSPRDIMALSSGKRKKLGSMLRGRWSGRGESC